ncbi:hypothetical protein HDV63DRAFT_132043 [Trichoderma sp. SZMC 28014]
MLLAVKLSSVLLCSVSIKSSCSAPDIVEVITCALNAERHVGPAKRPTECPTFFGLVFFGSGFLFGEVAGSAPRTVRGKEGGLFGELSAYSICFLGGCLSFFAVAE